jgi:lipopolysaccharide transport system permease protein
VVNDYAAAIIEKTKKIYKLLPPLLSRDIKERYAGSVFGVFWTFMQPLLFVLLYWLVFARILKIKIHTDTGEVPFFAFMLSGILPWFALQEGLFRGASSIIDRRHIIKKVIFPAELFPLSSVMSSFIHYGIGIVAFVTGFFIWKGEVSLRQVFLILLLLCLQILFTSGLSLLFAALSVYIRDIIQILGVALQVIFYMSTILYPITSVPWNLKRFIVLNPVTALTESYHNVILFNRYPESGDIIYLMCFTVILLLGGIFTFRKLKSGFADVL